LFTNNKNVIFEDNITLSKSINKGILVDIDAPTFGWRDIVGQITPRANGGTAPTLTACRGGSVLSYAYQVNDWIDQIVFHMSYDYVPGTNICIHVHCGQNGTAIAGNFILQIYALWCKGFNQPNQIFEAEVTPNISETVTSVSTHPRWGHFISEIQLSNAGGDSTHIDVSKLEVDGIFLISAKVINIPTITGSASSNLPFIFTLDLHYQSTNIATKAKAPNFYV
jgi:hypothetical protein